MRNAPRSACGLATAAGLAALAAAQAPDRPAVPSDPGHAAAIVLLERLGMPDVASAPLVQATTVDPPPGGAAEFLGFLDSDQGRAFSLWVGNPPGWPGKPPPRQTSAHPLALWTGIRPGGGRGDRYVPVEFVAEARRRLDAARSGEPLPAVFAARHAPGTELALWAWCAWRRRDARLAAELLDAAQASFDADPLRGAGLPLDVALERDLAEGATWELFEDFGDPTRSWAELRSRAAGILARYPNSPLVPRLVDAEALLRRQAAESLELAPWLEFDPSRPRRLAYDLVVELRTQNGRQLDQGGHADIWLDPRGDDSPAHRLRALGIDAAPALIDALDDARFTRTVGFVRSYRFSHRVVRVGEAARTVLMAIAGRGFADADDARGWLAAVEARGALAVLREAARRGDAAGLAQAARLAASAPDDAREVLPSGAAAAADDRVRAGYLELLARVDPDATATFRAHLDAPGPGARFAAAWALRHADPERCVGALLALCDEVPESLRGEPAAGPQDLPSGPSAAARAVALAVAGPPHAIDALAARGYAPSAELVQAVRSGWYAPSVRTVLAAPDAPEWRARLGAFCLDHLADTGRWRIDHRGVRSADHAAAILAALRPTRWRFDPAAPLAERDAAIRSIVGRAER